MAFHSTHSNGIAGSAGHEASPTMDPRGYQIEMFEASMKENIIVAMGTGSGKTMVARLRIEAELQRTSTKRVWFTTPNVLLAHQQHQFFSSQLPGYSFRLITGADNVEFWSTQQVWDSVLSGQHGIVSTPEVLRSALQHGFVSLSGISLLVFDEAHHCMKKNPASQIMQLWYFPLKASRPGDQPAILGLTASPLVQSNIEAMKTLEQNLNAVCRSPTLNLEEYRSFVHMPSFISLEFSHDLMSASQLLPILGRIIDQYSLATDPIYLKLKSDQSISAQVRLTEIFKKNETPILREIKRLSNQAEHLQQQLGSWASDRYIAACVAAFNDSYQHRSLFTNSNAERSYLHKILSPILLSIPNPTLPNIAASNVSGKAVTLIRYLFDNYESGDAAIVFVERRATAWALKELILSLENPSHWKPFALAGSSKDSGRGLADLIDQQMPHAELARFRRGLLNLGIVTSVMEEGIDVQACNLVICFDDSPNVKSFIQRRGRARHPGSRYVVLQDPMSQGRFAEYCALEEKMKAAYADQDRHVDAINQHELVEEYHGQNYHVESTGACLTIDQARSHLDNFCASLPHREGQPNRAPIYRMRGDPGHSVSCEVILPSSLPPQLQMMTSSTWKTERMAKKEAAFLAYIELHKHGLVNDNLLHHPVEAPDKTVEGRSSYYQAAPILNPWAMTHDANSPFHEHQILIQHPEIALPPLRLLLPVKICNQLMINLYGMSKAIATIHSSLWSTTSLHDQSSANEATKLLFSAVLKRRLGSTDLDKLSMPYYIIPDIPSDALESWVKSAKLSWSVPTFDFSASSQSSYLIQKIGESSPYIYKVYSPDGNKTPSFDMNSELELLRISRQMNFLLSSDPPVPEVRRVHNAGECLIIGLPPQYAVCMTYMPSIMHLIEIAIRAHLARVGPLSSIGFTALDETFISHALTAPGVAQSDYQRLEFIGDSLLKYWASIHVFHLNPYMTENMLSTCRDRLISNARLQRATRELRLEAYLTDVPFSAQKWSLELKTASQHPRKISSKTLADIVEAMIGVSYASAEHSPMDVNSQLIRRTLCLFLPEIKWQLPLDLIAGTKTMNEEGEQTQLLSNPESHGIASVEKLIGYRFANKALLSNALTHSTVQGGFQTYDRLEFLGDAIIDIVVNQKLWHSALEMSEGQMTARHASLVNKEIFAFLTTRLAVEKEETDAHVDPGTKSVLLTKRIKRICLHDFMISSGDPEFIQSREDFMERFESIKDKVEGELLTAREFPWIDLYHLNSPKWCSDILESIVGAVYLDSGASLQACESVLANAGLMKLVARAANEPDIIYRQPLVRLRILDPHLVVKRDKRRETETGPLLFECQILVNDTEVGSCTDSICQAEADNRAAQTVLEKIERGEIVLEKKTDEIITEEQD